MERRPKSSEYLICQETFRISKRFVRAQLNTFAFTIEVQVTGLAVPPRRMNLRSWKCIRIYPGGFENRYRSGGITNLRLDRVPRVDSSGSKYPFHSPGPRLNRFIAKNHLTRSMSWQLRNQAGVVLAAQEMYSVGTKIVSSLRA